MEGAGLGGHVPGARMSRHNQAPKYLYPGWPGWYQVPGPFRPLVHVISGTNVMLSVDPWRATVAAVTPGSQDGYRASLAAAWR